MIEANKPEISVDQLIDKIREEVMKHQSSDMPTTSISTITTSKPTVDFSHIEALIDNAESREHIRTKWPDKLNYFPFNVSKKFQKLALKVLELLFIDQREVNFNLLKALRESLLFNQQLIEQISTLQAQVGVIDNRVNVIDEQIGAIDSHANAIDEQIGAIDSHANVIDEQIGAIDNRVNVIDEQVGAVDNRVNAIDKQVGAVDNHVNAIDEQISVIDNHVNAIAQHVGAIDNRVNVINEQISVIDNHVNVIDEQISVIDNHVNVIDEQISVIDNHVNVINQQVNALNQQAGVIDNRVSVIDERHIRDDSYLKNDLTQQKRLITLFLEEARQRLPQSFNQEQLQNIVNEEQHSLDAFYAAFEDKFRGSREEIIDRFKVYLPLIEEANVGTYNSPILDVGCGRGEWLELLHKTGYIAQGLDINRVMIDQCRARGFKVIEGDVISYLQFIPDASLGALTGFHIVEHLPFKVLIKLFNETARVLKPGGMAIFETPNPHNVFVGSCSFYFDPTHRNPIPSQTMKFIAESQGLCRVQILSLNPLNAARVVEDSELSKQFNEYFYSDMDYAVIGFKL